jgi:hypothetical protein
LPAIELRRITEQVAAATLPTGIYRGAKARIYPNPHTADTLNFWIGWKKAIMTFSVWIGDHESGGGQLCSQIESFRTGQDTFAGIAPVGPKQLEGWNWNLNFMLNLRAAVLRADPAAEVHIVEAAG